MSHALPIETPRQYALDVLKQKKAALACGLWGTFTTPSVSRKNYWGVVGLGAGFGVVAFGAAGFGTAGAPAVAGAGTPDCVL